MASTSAVAVIAGAAKYENHARLTAKVEPFKGTPRSVPPNTNSDIA